MTLEECYAAMGGDYDGAMNRLRSEKLLMKFVLKFLEDPNMETLRTALAAGDQDSAFRAAHTLKGLCLNLGFTKLGDSSSQLTEAVRSSIAADASALMQQLESDYTEAIQTIRSMG